MALSSSTDSSPFILGQPDGGRGCTLATHLWTREVLDVIEQCVNLPSETLQIVRHYLRQQCISRGCQTLNQLQLLVRIGGRAKSVLELFLLLLDEQGLDTSLQVIQCMTLMGAGVRKHPSKATGPLRWV